jgi:hypothetical protein
LQISNLIISGCGVRGGCVMDLIGLMEENEKKIDKGDCFLDCWQFVIWKFVLY